MGGRSRAKEQGLTSSGIRLDAEGSVKGSPTLKPHIGEKEVAFRRYPRLALRYPLVNQEELCWPQQRADLASLMLQGRLDARTKLAEHMA